MKRIEIFLSGKSPSCFLSSRAVSNVEETLEYIPGSAVRGAFAKEWLQNNKADAKFKEIFTNGKVFFGNLYKDGADPIPLTGYSCKYYPGFKNDSDVGAGNILHGVKDLVVPSLKSTDGVLPAEYQECKNTLSSCSAPLKKMKGYYKRETYYKGVYISKRLIYHTSISPDTESAKESSLYSLEVIDEGQDFVGQIIFFDDLLADELLNFINGYQKISIGSDKSRGMGNFEIVSANFIDSQNDLQDRINQFNAAIGINDGKTYFTLTMKSDAIITDKFMRHMSYIDLSKLGAELVYGFNDTRTISGWNALLKLPKEDDMAIVKGSVFIYKIDRSVEEIINGLDKIETEGIGKRRAEGFGVVTVCDPFHWEGGDIK
jgi:CRISPR-associated protein Csx10